MRERVDVVCRGKNGALLREAAALDSAPCGQLANGERVFVEAEATVGGKARLRVRNGARAGWCSAKLCRDPPAPHALRECVLAATDAKRRWLASAAALRDVVLEMRREGPAAWSGGMREMLGPLAAFCVDDDALIRRTEPTDYGKLATELYQNLAYVSMGARETTVLQRALAALTEVVEAECAPQPDCWPGERELVGIADGELRGLDAALASSGFPPRPPGAAVFAVAPSATGAPLLLKYLALPFALYVRNTTHLYAVLRKLHGLRRVAYASPADLRRDLDAGGQKSAWLVFSLFACLQVLRRARRDRGPGAVEPLAATAPMVWGAECLDLPAYLAGGAGAPPAFHAHDARRDAPRHAYRGIWVPDVVDESRCRFSTSIASYARTMRGVCGVLDFYAGNEGTEAAACARDHAHVLILVLRHWRDSEWLTPVQFFSDKLVGPQEQELARRARVPGRRTRRRRDGRAGAGPAAVRGPRPRGRPRDPRRGRRRRVAGLRGAPRAPRGRVGLGALRDDGEPPAGGAGRPLERPRRGEGDGGADPAPHAPLRAGRRGRAARPRAPRPGRAPSLRLRSRWMRI